MYLAYFIPPMSIGVEWIEHSELTEALERVDAGFLLLNLLLPVNTVRRLLGRKSNG